jgi:hypothetical protein
MSALSKESKTPVTTNPFPSRKPSFPIGISFEPGFLGPGLPPERKFLVAAF